MFKHSTHKALSNRHLCRLAALLLAVCLLPLLPMAAGANELERGNLFGSRLTDLQDGISSMAMVGDTLFIRTYQALYSFSPGDQKAVKRADMKQNGFGNYAALGEGDSQEPSPTVIFSNNDSLMGIDYNRQTVYTMTLEGDSLTYSNPIKLDLAEFMEGEPPFVFMMYHPSWVKAAGGRLFLSFRNYENKPVDLYSFDLETGERREHQVNHLQAAAIYKDGSFIAVQADPNNMYDEQTGRMRPPQLVVFDPAADSVKPLDATLDIVKDTGSFADLWYDQAADSLFTHTDTDVYRLDGNMKETTLIGYLPMLNNFWDSLPGSVQGLPGDRVAIGFFNNVFIRPRTEKGKEGITVLSMSGGMDDDGLVNRILMEMDDIVLRRVEGVEYSYVNADQLASMFLTGNVPVDIMTINAYGFDLDKLIQKGYLADLSGSPAIREHLSSMAPNLSRAFMEGEKIFALPGNIQVFPLSARIKAFSDLGLDYPTSITGLVELAEEWMGGLYKEHPEYNLFSSEPNIKKTLKNLVIDKYISGKLGAGEELAFDTPLFRGLMQRIDAIDWQGFDQDPDWENETSRNALEEFWQKTSLLETGMGYEPRYMGSFSRDPEHQTKPLVLPLEDGMEAYNEADFNLLVVLSSSKNQEAAQRFLEHFIQKLNQVEKAAVNLQATAAIPNPNYEKELKDIEKGIAQVEAQLKKAEGVEKSNLEEILKNSRSYYELRKETGRMLVTEEDMAEIHAVVSRLVIFTGKGNAQRQAFNDDYELREQYYKGVISLDQFIKQVDDKLRLVRMEYN